MEVIRNYSHRTFGEIGEVTLVAPKGKWTLDGKELPEGSVRHLVSFALQTLQDAYAGSKTADEAKADFAKKYDKLVAGTLGVRTGGGGVDETTRVRRRVVFAALKGKFGADSPEWKEFTGRSDEAQATRLDEVYADNEAIFADAVAKELAELAAKRERKAGLAKAKLDIKL